jgi:hypothetical protein
MSNWSTPSDFDAKDCTRIVCTNIGGCRTLANDIAQWRSPLADHSHKGGSQASEQRLAGGHTLDLQDQAEHWKP